MIDYAQYMPYGLSRGANKSCMNRATEAQCDANTQNCLAKPGDAGTNAQNMCMAAHPHSKLQLPPEHLASDTPFVGLGVLHTCLVVREAANNKRARWNEHDTEGCNPGNLAPL